MTAGRATVPADGEGVPRGFKTGLSDRIFCDGPGGLPVSGPDARPPGLIATPEKSTNFRFGGPAHAALHITTSTSVHAVETLPSTRPMRPGRGN